MKLIDTIKDTRCLQFKDIQSSGSCSIVGNSGMLLKQNFGHIIDNSDQVIRFNGAKTESYESFVGSKTSIRILNCHYILNIDNLAYYNNQKTRFPSMDRYFLYDLRGENLVFKTDPSWKLWEKREILKKVENNNNVFFISEEFYNLGKKINNGIEPTNGFIGLMLALKLFNNIKCFGFSFYDGEDPEHYYEKINCNPKNNHNFEREKIIFNLLNKNEIIKLF